MVKIKKTMEDIPWQVTKGCSISDMPCNGYGLVLLVLAMYVAVVLYSHKQGKKVTKKETSPTQLQ